MQEALNVSTIFINNYNFFSNCVIFFLNFGLINEFKERLELFSEKNDYI